MQTEGLLQEWGLVAAFRVYESPESDTGTEIGVSASSNPVIEKLSFAPVSLDHLHLILPLSLVLNRAGNRGVLVAH